MGEVSETRQLDFRLRFCVLHERLARGGAADAETGARWEEDVEEAFAAPDAEHDHAHGRHPGHDARAEEQRAGADHPEPTFLGIWLLSILIEKDHEYSTCRSNDKHADEEQQYDSMRAKDAKDSLFDVGVRRLARGALRALVGHLAYKRALAGQVDGAVGAGTQAGEERRLVAETDEALGHGKEVQHDARAYCAAAA